MRNNNGTLGYLVMSAAELRHKTMHVFISGRRKEGIFSLTGSENSPRPCVSLKQINSHFLSFPNQRVQTTAGQTVLL